MVPIRYFDQVELDNEVERAKLKLGPEVVRIKHSLGEDTSGDPAIYFRIVLADWAVREETLGDMTGQIAKVFRDELRPLENWGLIPYFRFRKQSERAKMNDLAWA